MTQLKRKVSRSFLVHLSDTEVREKQNALVEMHGEAAKLQDEADGLTAKVKTLKDRIKVKGEEMRDLARVCADGMEQQFIKDAEEIIDTSTWTSVVFHPRDGRILEERTITGEERKEIAQVDLFKDEVDAEREPSTRKRKASPAAGDGVKFNAANEETAADEAREAANRG